MQEREISLDTETTGFRPHEGHRIVEIGCVEMINRIPTGKIFHKYINPQRDMPIGAFNVHGLSEEFLKDKPLFSEVCDEFVEFIGNAKLIIHNAQFDMNFLNAELFHIKKKGILNEQAFCTLEYARKKFPGSPASLDALCKRFGIDNSSRTKHGALLDAELLAEMYLELMGGPQVALDLGMESKGNTKKAAKKTEKLESRPIKISDDELLKHNEFITGLKDPLWLK